MLSEYVMVFLWIGIGIGILIALILIVKLFKTPSHEAVSISSHCKICGSKLYGLKCNRCSKKDSFGI